MLPTVSESRWPLPGKDILDINVMRYSAQLQYVNTFLNYERIPFKYQRELNLSRMRKILSWFNHPEKSFQSVLVAGTKGKGSTANFLASILAAAGQKIGLYTSPHLIDPRERIRVDGAIISKSDFCSLVDSVKPVIEKRKSEVASQGMITFFELFTLLAVLYFKKRGVQFGIFEIGMGGRLDATNALTPLVSMITPISFDHEEHLGNTLGQIAREKAAIIKENAWVISGPQKSEARNVIKKEISKKHAKALFYGSTFQSTLRKISAGGSFFDFKIKSFVYKNLQIHLPGVFQVQNAAVAVAAALILKKCSNFDLHESSIRRGLLNAFWPGRFEIIKHHSNTFILDGAHNDASMEAVSESIRKLFPGKKCAVIFGISREKNLERTLKPLLGTVDLLIATKSNNVRAQEPKIILEKLHDMNFRAPSFPTFEIREAIRLAKQLTTDSVVLITGSLFLVGEAREFFKCRM